MDRGWEVKAQEGDLSNQFDRDLSNIELACITCSRYVISFPHPRSSIVVTLTQYSEEIRSVSAVRHEELKRSLLYPTVVYIYRLLPSTYIRERRVAQVRYWNWLAKYLGIKSGVIISTAKDQSTFTTFARWPLLLPFGFSQVITAQFLFQNGLPCLPKLGLRPQTVVSKDSEIIRACEAGDITGIQRLFKIRQAQPNDRTTDDLTVLRVSTPAFRSSPK